MKISAGKLITFYLVILAVASFLFCSGCMQQTDGLAQPRIGIDAGSDSGNGIDLKATSASDVDSIQPDSLQPDLLQANNPDAKVQVPDSKPIQIDVKPDLQSDFKPDLQPIPCDSTLAREGQTKVVATFSTAAYCFKVCPALFEPIDPLDYGWLCMDFDDGDRTVLVNGQKVSCHGNPPNENIGQALPALINSAWTFVLPEGKAGAISLTLAGKFRNCP